MKLLELILAMVIGATGGWLAAWLSADTLPSLGDPGDFGVTVRAAHMSDGVSTDREHRPLGVERGGTTKGGKEATETRKAGRKNPGGRLQGGQGSVAGDETSSVATVAASQPSATAPSSGSGGGGSSQSGASGSGSGGSGSGGSGDTGGGGGGTSGTGGAGGAGGAGGGGGGG